MNIAAHEGFAKDQIIFWSDYSEIFDRLAVRFQQQVDEAMFAIVAYPLVAGHFFYTGERQVKHLRRRNFKRFPFFHSLQLRPDSRRTLLRCSHPLALKPEALARPLSGKLNRRPTPIHRDLFAQVRPNRRVDSRDSAFWKKRNTGQYYSLPSATSVHHSPRRRRLFSKPSRSGKTAENAARFLPDASAGKPAQACCLGGIGGLRG